MWVDWATPSNGKRITNISQQFQNPLIVTLIVYFGAVCGLFRCSVVRLARDWIVFGSWFGNSAPAHTAPAALVRTIPSQWSDRIEATVYWWKSISGKRSEGVCPTLAPGVPTVDLESEDQIWLTGNKNNRTESMQLQSELANQIDPIEGWEAMIDTIFQIKSNHSSLGSLPSLRLGSFNR